MTRAYFLIAMFTVSVIAIPTTTRADGATVINLVEACHFFNGDGVWSPAIGDCDFHIVFAANGRVAQVIASGVITPASGGRAAHFDSSNTGIPCVIDTTPFTTDDWQETVSPSGEVNMHCNFH